MNLHHSNISKESIMTYIEDVLDSGFLNEGKYVELFEDKLKEHFDLKNPVAVNSCTSALHMAINLLDIVDGDEIILTPQTFVATGLSVLYERAKPVFVDIQKDTGNIDPKSIRKNITNKTKAIIVVHWAGYPCDMDEINEIAKEYNISVIEDAAHALGSTYKNRSIGSISRFTAFSFQSIKHMTTGDGGALCCLRDDDYNIAKQIKWFGIDKENSKPSILGEREYDINRIGFKYHMNNLVAAVGLGNLTNVENVLNRHKEISEFYNKELNNIDGVKLLNYKDDRTSTYWLYTILVDRRDDFIRAMKDRGIPTSVIHQRIDRNSIFGGMTKGLVNQEYFDDHQVNIPIHCALSDNDLDEIIKNIKKGW